MASRFYLPSSGAADVSPAVDAAWNVNTASPSRLKMVQTRINSSMASTGPISETASSIQNILHRQYVSEPIGAQTITGTVTGWVRASENNISANASGQLIVRVVSNDGSTVRGTLFAGTTATGTGNPTNEFTTTLSARLFPATGGTLTSVTAQNGDRLVVEVGSRNHNTVATNYTTTLSFGDNSATDLSAAAETAANNPWIEFSATILPVSVEEIGAAAFSAAANATTAATRTRHANSSLSASATQAVAGQKTILGQTTLSASGATGSVLGQMVLGQDFLGGSVFATRSRTGESALSATVTTTASAVYQVGISETLSGSVSAVVGSEVSRLGVAIFNASTDLVASLSAIRVSESILDATGTQAATGQRTQTGESPLSAESSVVAPSSIARSGASDLSAESSATIPSSVLRSGSSTLSADTLVVVPSSVIRSSESALSADASAVIPSSVLRSGESPLSGVSSVDASSSATRSGESMLDADSLTDVSSSIIRSGESLFDATGLLDSAAHLVRSVASDLVGNSDISINVLINEIASADLAAVASLLTSASATITATSLLEGSASSSVVVERQQVGTFAGEGTGDLSAATQRITVAASDLSAAADVSATPFLENVILSGASLSATASTGSVLGQFVLGEDYVGDSIYTIVERIAASILTAVATQDVAAQRQRTGTLDASAEAVLWSLASGEKQSSASLDAVSTLIANGTLDVAIFAQASLDARGDLAPSAVFVASAAGSFTTEAAIAVGASRTAQGQTSLSGVSSVLTSTQVTREAASVLSGVSSLLTPSSVTKSAASDLSGTTLLLIDGDGILFGTVALSSVASLTSSSLYTARGHSNLSGASDLLSEAFGLYSGEGVFAGASNLDVLTERYLNIVLSLSSSGSLLATVSERRPLGGLIRYVGPQVNMVLLVTTAIDTNVFSIESIDFDENLFNVETTSGVGTAPIALTRENASPAFIITVVPTFTGQDMDMALAVQAGPSEPPLEVTRTWEDIHGE